MGFISEASRQLFPRCSVQHGRLSTGENYRVHVRALSAGVPGGVTQPVGSQFPRMEKLFRNTIPCFNPHNNPVKRHRHHPHSTAEDTDAQKG